MVRDRDGRQDAGDGARPLEAVRAPGRAPAIDAAARARIGRGLRAHYAAVLSQPVPDRLRALLDDLAARPDRESQR